MKTKSMANAPTKSYLSSNFQSSSVQPSSFQSSSLQQSKRQFRQQVKHQLKPKQPFKQQAGFTLIEVMVALAILAVVAVAASRASSAYLRSVDILRTRTLAHFVAQNTASELQMNQTWFAGVQSKQVNAQGRDWQVVMTTEDTVIPALRKVTIAVAPILDGQPTDSVTDLSVMISDPNQTGTIDLSGFR